MLSRQTTSKDNMLYDSIHQKCSELANLLIPEKKNKEWPFMRLGLLSEDSRMLKAFIYTPPPKPVMR